MKPVERVARYRPQAAPLVAVLCATQAKKSGRPNAITLEAAETLDLGRCQVSCVSKNTKAMAMTESPSK